MTSTSAEASTRITYRSVLVLAALVLLPGLAYVAGVLLPYYASDLDTLSLADLAAGRSHRTIPVPWRGWLSLLGFYSHLPDARSEHWSRSPGARCSCSRRSRAPSGGCPRASRPAWASSPSVCVATVTFLLSPLGRALTSWQLD